MSELAEKCCVPCEGGVPALDQANAEAQLRSLNAAWALSADGKSLTRSFSFRDFFRTMSFVNALAHIANTEDHHPDLEIGYNYCRVRYTTHAINGLSQNDFICAAKIDRLALV
jgi:4a-hydroxytetrahydrobiopterin dehydratase